MNSNEFSSLVKGSERPLVVYFWAVWCGPCRAIKPALSILEARYKGQVDLLRINTDEHPGLLHKLGIFGIPTLAAYRDGVEITRRTGAGSQAVLEGVFQAALTGEAPKQQGLSSIDRLVRLGLGLSLLGVGLITLLSQNSPAPVSIGIILAGLLLSFMGVYDRCPVYQAVRSWVRAQLKSEG